MSAEVAPSGDLYASASHVARLEELVYQQQHQITSLLNERTVFQEDFKSFLDHQLQRSAGQRGAKGHEAMSTHTFLATELTSAVQTIRNDVHAWIQDALPLKKLQAIEQRLLAKPTASEDIQSLAVRMSQLESRPIQLQPHQQTQFQQQPVQSLTNSEDFQRLQQHVSHLEELLLNEIQKAHKTASTKTGDLGAPLQRLQAQVNQLLLDVQHIKGLDGQKLAEAILTTSMKAHKEEIGHQLATKASTNDLQRIQQAVDRIEAFSRDVQINVLQVSNAQERLDKDMREQFSEARWSVVSNSVKAAAKATLEEQKVDILAFANEQHTKALEQITKAEQLVKQLDREVRTQYGPEMLQRHLETLQTTLQADQRNHQEIFQAQTTTQLTDMVQQIQSHRQHSLDVAADIKSQLQASELAKRYKAFEDTILKHESTFAGFQKRYDSIGHQLEDQVRKAELIQNDVSDQIVGLEQSLTAMAQTIRTEQHQMRQQITDWASQRKLALDEQFHQYSDDLQTLKDSLLTTAKEIHTTQTSWKEEQQKWIQEGTTLHTKAEQTLKTWMEAQESYLYSRVVDMSGRVQSLQTTVEKQNDDVKTLLSDETLQQFVSEIEKRVRQTQEDWGQRRVMDLGSKFSEYEKTIKQTATEIQETQQRYGDEVSKTLRDLQNQQQSTLHKALLDTQGEVREIAKRCDTEVKASIASLKTLTTDVVALQDSYRKQTDRAVKEEEYKAFQTAIQKQFEGFRTDTNSKLFHAITQYKTEAQQALVQVKETQQNLTTMFSEETFANHIQQVEKKVRSDLNGWQRTVQSSLSATQQKLKEQSEDLTTAVGTLEQTVYSTLSSGFVELSSTKHQIEAEWKTLSKEFALAFTTHAKDWNEKEVSLLKQTEAQFASYRTQFQKLEEQIQREVRANVKNSLEHLHTEFTNGVRTLTEIKQNATELQEQLVKQINDAVTREKYREYQTALENRISELLTSTTTTLDTHRQQTSESVDSALERIDAQSKTWAQMLSETRLRQFVEAIEKRLRAQQDNWTARRTEEIQDSFETIKGSIQTYKKSTDEALGTIGRTELTLRNSFGNLEKQLQTKQDAWMQKNESSFEALQKEFTMTLQAYGTGWDLKQNRIDEQVQAWTKQILAFQSQKRQELTEQFKAETLSIQDRITALRTELSSEIKTSVEAANAKRATILQELDTRVKKLLQDWMSAKTEELTTRMEVLDGQSKELYVSIQQQYTLWKNEKTSEFETRLKDVQSQQILIVRQQVSEQLARGTKAVAEMESRVATQVSEFQTEQMTTLQSFTEQLSKARTQIQEIQQQTSSNATALQGIPQLKLLLEQQIQKALAVLRQELTAVIAKRVEDLQPLLQKSVSETINTTVQKNLFELPKQKSVSETINTKVVDFPKPTKVQGLTKCFYTALIGVPGQPTDTLSKIPKIEGWDCICFTNLPQGENTGWTIVPVSYSGTHPAVEAKKYKWLSQQVLADYDVVVWVDAYLAPSVQSMPMLNQILMAMIEKQVLICHRPHTERKCIWQECDAVVKAKRDTEQNVGRVRKILQDAKMPTNWGLFDTNVLIRFHKNQAVQRVSEAIYKQVSTVSSRDQLAVSLYYYTMCFKAFTTQPLSNIVTRTGTHIRLDV